MPFIISFFTKNNLLPYVAIVIMAYFLYLQYTAGIKKDIEIQNAKISAEQANINMNYIVGYTESKFNKLENLKSDTWEEGKHEKIISYNQ